MPSDPKDDLEDRIKAARNEYNEDYNPKTPEPTHIGGAGIGYEFLAYVISGGLLGYFSDKFFDTAPWGILLGFLFGMVGGVYRAQDRMKKSHEKSEDS